MSLAETIIINIPKLTFQSPSTLIHSYARSGVHWTFNGIASIRSNFIDMAMLCSIYAYLYTNDIIRSFYNVQNMFLMQQAHY